ncbi:7990_t:CDS:2 [Funneliformis geosporum]|uniref:10428_t:CDS:1 n=1 Tax=Funneliformis geosporum TaxID=1117311 RepID=A0A9W4SH76_9GLOM|nr:7990_t:CDS:2 [Funneliformis geosporum]CAI2169582.1 10428_t:CDS:2 [Funneliformis geosporum]
MKMYFPNHIRPLSFILIISVERVSSQQQNRTYTKTPDYPYNDKTGFYLLTILSLIFQQLSLLGCLYVFYGTYRRWRDSSGSLPMALKIPFYFAVTDFLLYTMNFPNILFLLMFRHAWPDPVCPIIGFMTSFYAALNMILHLMISIMTYVRLCHNENFSSGVYDWKLLLIVISTSMLFALVPTYSYGVDIWWCSISRERDSKVAYLAIIVTFGVVLINAFCYISVKRQIHGIEHSLHRKCVKKFVTYVSIFVLQWFFSFPNHITRLIADRSVWTFVLYVVSMNFGGILNGFQYHMSEGWPVKNQDDQQPIMRVAPPSSLTSVISHSTT